jgi:hypothetical protein
MSNHEVIAIDNELLGLLKPEGVQTSICAANAINGEFLVIVAGGDA